MSALGRSRALCMDLDGEKEPGMPSHRRVLLLSILWPPQFKADPHRGCCPPPPPPRTCTPGRSRAGRGLARPGPEDEGLMLLVLHGWRALSAAAAKAAPAVPWTSRSSIKVHRIRAPVGCSRHGKEGAEPPYLGRVQAPGAVCAMPRAPPPKKKKPTLGARSQHSPCSLPWLGLQQGKTHFFYIFWGQRGGQWPRFSPAG